MSNESTIQAVAEAVGPSLVRVGRDRRGVGVVVGDGLVVTNAHHVRGEELTLTFPDGRVLASEVRGIDLDGDLAVVAADTAGASALELAGEAPPLGRDVFAVTPTFDGGTRVTTGAVSALARKFRGPRGRRIAGGVEHTAPLPPGSSGAPIVDAEGRLLGINTHRLEGGFYLALPADDTLRARIDALAGGERPQRRSLGVAVVPPRVARRLRRAVGLPDRDGVLVRHVEPGSPANRAGVKEGDLVVSAGGAAVASVDDLHIALDAVGDGGALGLGVVRGIEESEVQVRFEDEGP